MAVNHSVLTLPRPFISPLPDFDICDRRYGMKLDIPRCDVAASRLDVGSASTSYHVSDQAGPQTLPQSINYGGCMISVEVAGPHPPQTYTLVPDTVRSIASHLINECVGRAGKVGGFATLDIGRLIDFVINPNMELDEYHTRGRYERRGNKGTCFERGAEDVAAEIAAVPQSSYEDVGRKVEFCLVGEYINK
ncbi:MAG: hypothetical protein LQ337_004769, partial [Flavoplaca oasis]